MKVDVKQSCECSILEGQIKRGPVQLATASDPLTRPSLSRSELMSDYIRIPLGHGKSAIIDADDAELVSPHSWSVLTTKTNLYAQAKITVDGKRRSVYLHRLVMGAQPGETIDHINRDGLDCRRSNLRVCTPSQNAMNRLMPTAISQYRGVYRHSKSRGWQVSLRVNGKYQYVGYFLDPEDAARAYDAAALKHFGEFAVLNFPDEHVSQGTFRIARLTVR